MQIPRDGSGCSLGEQASTVTSILGQVHAEPILGTWEATKAFWFSAMEYEIHAEEVRQFHLSDATTLIVEAPARGSKSYSTAHDIIPYCLPTKPLLDSRHAIVGTSYDTNKEFEYVHDRLVKERERFCIDGSGYTVERSNFNPRSGDMEIVLNLGPDKNGIQRRSVIKGLSSRNEVSLQGEQWTTVTLSEAAEHDPEVLTKHFSTRKWRTYLPTTPKSKAKWLKDLGDYGRSDPNLGISVFRFPPDANPFYDWDNFRKEERLATIKAKIEIGPDATAKDDPHFAEQFLGEWVYYKGSVLPFQRSRNVIPFDAVRSWLGASSIWLSTDYGYEDPFSAGLWAVLPNGLYVRFDEIYQRKLSTGDVADRIRSMLASHGIDKGRVTATGDPSKPEIARLLQDEGIAIVEMDKNAQRERGAGKRRLSDLLVEGHIPKPDGRGFYPGLYVTSNCEATISEWETLHYKDSYTNEDSHTAFNGPDHAFDDARYFVMSRPLPKREGRSSDWLTDWRRSRGRGTGAGFHDVAGTAAYA